MQVDSALGLAAALGCAVFPATSTLTGILLLETHLMEKMSMTGAPPGPLLWGPDAILGALFGAGTFVFGGFIVPWLAHCIRRNFKVAAFAHSPCFCSCACLWVDPALPGPPLR